MTDLPHEAELVAREPIFHHHELIWDEQSFDEQVADDFSEIGASGTCYERKEVKEIVLGRLAGTHLDSLPTDYRIEDAHVVPLGAGVVQVRSTLHGQGRVTRRSTVYRHEESGWKAVFHQGTVVQGAEPSLPDREA